VDEAEAVLKAIIEISLKPRMDLDQLAREALSKSPDPDPFLTFSLVCRADLDNVRRGRVAGLVGNGSGRRDLRQPGEGGLIRRPPVKARMRSAGIVETDTNPLKF
jgi:hypothetical protein